MRKCYINRAFTMADRWSRSQSDIHLLGYSSAFTMAEILISLTIIGVIAAITLPALRNNINETTWNTQRKALYSRLSQAIAMMPSLNGYGNFQGTWQNDVVTPTEDTAAATFVNDGLAKVFQINNICSIPMETTPENARKELLKCGISKKITTMSRNKINFPTKLSEFNPMFTGTYSTTDGQQLRNPQKNINTNAAAFETKNGESVAVFYNPYCQFDNDTTGWYYVQSNMCANFIYDLNGRKGPNKVGKDIGFITALYPTSSEVVAPMPFEKEADGGIQSKAAAKCSKKYDNSRVPNRNELSALFYNRELIGLEKVYYWSNSLSSSDASLAYRISLQTGRRVANDRFNTSARVLCIKR